MPHSLHIPQVLFEEHLHLARALSILHYSKWIASSDSLTPALAPSSIDVTFFFASVKNA